VIVIGNAHLEREILLDLLRGCIIGNLSTALADTHEAFRQRLAGCFDEMAREFLPDLEAAARQGRSQGTLDAWTLARYLLTVVEGAIMLARTYRDRTWVARHFGCLKEYLVRTSDHETFWPRAR
jgi:TetR/AcrR family transcriptional repressor of nem operon